MTNTTVTFRTDAKLKEEASTLFESLGMNLSTAINMFMRQAVAKQKFPCSLELNITESNEALYSSGFFELFGTGKDLGFDEEPPELSFDSDREILPL